MFEFRRWIAALLPAIVVSGCVSYAPHPLVPDDELAALKRKMQNKKKKRI